MLFICKVLLQKLPGCLYSLLAFKHITYNVRSQDVLTLAVTEFGKSEFKYFAEYKWNELQK